MTFTEDWYVPGALIVEAGNKDTIPRFEIVGKIAGSSKVLIRALHNTSPYPKSAYILRKIHNEDAWKTFPYLPDPAIGYFKLSNEPSGWNLIMPSIPQYIQYAIAGLPINEVMLKYVGEYLSKEVEKRGGMRHVLSKFINEELQN